MSTAPKRRHKLRHGMACGFSQEEIEVVLKMWNDGIKATDIDKRFNLIPSEFNTKIRSLREFGYPFAIRDNTTLTQAPKPVMFARKCLTCQQAFETPNRFYFLCQYHRHAL